MWDLNPPSRPAEGLTIINHRQGLAPNNFPPAQAHAQEVRGFPWVGGVSSGDKCALPGGVSVQEHMAAVPMALGPAEAIEAFLRELDIPAACVLSFDGPNVGEGTDMGSPLNVTAMRLHYSLPGSVQRIELPDLGLGLGEKLERLSPYACLVHPAENRLREAVGGGFAFSAVTEMYARDMPALQKFLQHFLSDSNLVRAPNAKAPRLAAADLLGAARRYSLALDTDGIFRLLVRTDNAPPPTTPVPRTTSRASLQKASSFNSRKSSTGSVGEVPTTGRKRTSISKPVVAYDTYTVQPVFSPSNTRLVCMVTYEASDPPETASKRKRRPYEVLALSCTVCPSLDFFQYILCHDCLILNRSRRCWSWCTPSSRPRADAPRSRPACRPSSRAARPRSSRRSSRSPAATPPRRAAVYI
jgi:hypothetical protein